MDPASLIWRDQLIFTRDIVIPGERTAFYLRVRAQDYVSLRRGVYCRKATWESLSADDRCRLRIGASVAHAQRDLVVSHVAAAYLWRLPWTGSTLRRVDVLGVGASGGRSTSRLAHHVGSVRGDEVMIDGIVVTPLARTVVDVASRKGFVESVAIADSALRRTTHPDPALPRTTITSEDLLRALDHVPVTQGRVKARRVMEFADGRADRPGESISRANIHLSGLRAPKLQQRLRGFSGREWVVDFYWERSGIIGEFDGRAKYTDERFLKGRSPGDVVFEEKQREDDLRAAGFRVCRWTWNTATNQRALRDLLLAAGVR